MPYYSPMLKGHRSSGKMSERVRALVVVFQLAVFALVAPMLVLCEDGDRHAAVESVMSHCCHEGAAGLSDANRAAETQGTAGDGCAGFCTDTPFLTGIDLISPRNIAQGFESLAVLQLIGFAPNPAPLFARRDVHCRRALSPPAFGRSTVLLI